MVAEAERNRGVDQQLREQIDASNELDSIAYQVERRLGDLGEGAPTHERARAEMLISDARQAIKDEAPIDRIRSLRGELEQVYQALMTHGAVAPDASQPQRGGSQDESSGEDVIDAEFNRT
jgi:molecular chaperone DnaK